MTGLEYIRSSEELCKRGLYVELGAYKYHVFIDFREVRDNQWRHYAQIANDLNGRGVPSIEETLKEMLLHPLHEAFKGLVNADTFRRLMEARIVQPQAQLDQKLMEEIEKKMRRLLREAKQLSGGERDRDDDCPRDKAEIGRPSCTCPSLLVATRGSNQEESKPPQNTCARDSSIATTTWATLFGWLFVHALGKVVNQREFAGQSHTWIEEWGFGKALFRVSEGFWESKKPLT